MAVDIAGGHINIPPAPAQRETKARPAYTPVLYLEAIRQSDPAIFKDSLQMPRATRHNMVPVVELDSSTILPRARSTHLL